MTACVPCVCKDVIFVLVYASVCVCGALCECLSVKTTCTSHLQNHMLVKSNWGEILEEKGGEGRGTTERRARRNKRRNLQ